MKDKLKLICCVAVAVLVLLCGISAFVFLSRSATLLSALPLPDETRPYALVEAKDGGYPTALSSLLTDGAYAQFRAGTAQPSRGTPAACRPTAPALPPPDAVIRVRSSAAVMLAQ